MAIKILSLIIPGASGDTLAALVHLANPSGRTPELELNTSDRISDCREKGYDREIIAAFLPWARERYGFHTFACTTLLRGTFR
jgi:hypothetical protein